MTIVSVSRKKICDAIAKEPTTRLNAGSWVDEGGDVRHHEVRSRDCTVCAVGAVMRNALLHPRQEAFNIENAAQASILSASNIGLHGDPMAEIRKGRYMAALSSFFEGQFVERDIPYVHNTRARMKAVKQLKADCIKFVRDNFPAQLEINIDGARPAEDVKVVRED
jgi:hypothetical protein